VARDQRDQRNQRNQAGQAGKPDQADRTRLNAELSYQYARQVGRKKAEPGRGGMSEELGDLAEAQVEPDLDASEHEAASEHADAAQAIAPEPRKSIFELPRRDPARPDLPSDTAGLGGTSKPT
jgi:hypothetical protein